MNSCLTQQLEELSSPADASSGHVLPEGHGAVYIKLKIKMTLKLCSCIFYTAWKQMRDLQLVHWLLALVWLTRVYPRGGEFVLCLLIEEHGAPRLMDPRSREAVRGKFL